PDEHLKLARASLDFYPDLDSAFQVNVSKVSTVLPAELRERLAEPVESWARAAQAAYREHSRDDGDGISRTTSPKTVRSALERAARRTGTSRALKRLISDIQESAPKVARRLGW